MYFHGYQALMSWIRLVMSRKSISNIKKYYDKEHYNHKIEYKYVSIHFDS